MTQWPCDAPGGEATMEAPLLDLEKCVSEEEQAAPSPADDGGATTSGQSGTCGQWFLRVILGGVWLYVVNQMRISFSACEDAETRALMAVMMVVIALSLGTVFGTICIGEEPAASSYTRPSSHSRSRDESSLFTLDVTNGIFGLSPHLAKR